MPSSSETHLQETHQILLLLGKLDGQMTAMHGLLRGHTERMDRQDQRLDAIDERVTALRKDVFKSIDAHKKTLGEDIEGVEKMADKANYRTALILGVAVTVFAIVQVVAQFIIPMVST